MNTQPAKTILLRRVLQANGVFSALSGLVIIASARPLASLLGLQESLTLTIIAISLLIFATTLFWNARRENINPVDAWVAVGLDVAWVVGSVVLIFAGVLSVAGNWLVAVVADIVLLFAALQFYGLRKLRRQTISPRGFSDGI